MGLRKSVLIYLIGIQCLVCFGQTEDRMSFYLGPESTEKRNQTLLNIFGHQSDHFYCLYAYNQNKGKFRLEKMETDSLTPIATTKFQPIEVSGKFPVLAYPFCTKAACFLIATADDPKSSKVYILAYQIGENLEIPKTPKVLGIANRDALLEDDGFLLFKTNDGEKVVLYIPEEVDEEKNEKFLLRYFDSKLDLLDTKKVELPYKSSVIQLEDAVLSQTGIFHGIISIKSTTEVRLVPDSYALISYDPKGDRLKENALALGNKWFYNVNMSLTPDTSLWLSGYYSNMVEPSMAGVFSVVLNAQDGTLIKTGISPFDREFRLLLRNNKRSEDDFGLFKTDRSLLNTDGSLSLISEKRYERLSTMFNPATGIYSTIQINYNEEVLVSSIRPNSEIITNIILPKYQSFSRSSGRYTSYVSKQWNDRLVFFYNEHNRNVELSPYDYEEYRSLNNENNMSISYCLLEKGEVVKKPILPDIVDNYYLHAEHSYAQKGFAILTLFKGYKTRFLKVVMP